MLRFRRPTAWYCAALGLGMLVFAVVALSSPGRIDVVDGHTRYDVGRSYLEHFDSVVRDPTAWFAVLPGRNGGRYSSYRFPQSAVAALSILTSDITGVRSEARRHFFFSLSGAMLAAAMAVLYAFSFRRMGHADAASLAWAAGGIVCTPVWFYSTTTFDDVLGSLAIVAATTATLVLGERKPIAAATASGLLLAFAFNCKPPLALFTPVVAAILWTSQTNGEQRLRQAKILMMCLVLGGGVCKLYDLWKFPPSTWGNLAEAQGAFVGLWPGNTLAGLLSFLISPGMGAIWYWPALIIALYGLAAWNSNSGQRWVVWSVVASSAAFVLFIASIRFFSGEPAWGPRYLTPLFALLWFFVPAGANRLGLWKTTALLCVSFLVQIAGLSIDTMRFFAGERESSASRFLEDPWSYFEFDRSQLLAWPRQIFDVVADDGPRATRFSPAKLPTLPWYVFVVDSGAKQQGSRDSSPMTVSSAPNTLSPAEAVESYVRTRKPLDPRTSHVINSFRPWWSSYRYLPRNGRPVDLDAAIAFLFFIGAAGLATMFYGSSEESAGRFWLDSRATMRFLRHLPGK
ncbi:MAG TPA: hypothetical protein VF278_10820 [Pirellulales bacterium]